MNKGIAVKLAVTILWGLSLLHRTFFSIIPCIGLFAVAIVIWGNSWGLVIPVLLYLAWFIPVSLIAAKVQVKQECKNCFLPWLFRIRRKAGEI